MDYRELYRSKVIDNRTFILADVLKYLFRDTENNATDIAVGYFYSSGLLTMKEEIQEFMDQKNGNLRIIMGNETSKETADLLTEKSATSEYLNNIPKMLSEDITNIVEDDFLIKLRTWIADDRLEIRVYTGSANYFHAKTYLFYNRLQDIKGETITGSSNFSLSGLKGNTELNVLGSENFLSLKEWFDSLWESDEVSLFSVELLNIIDEYKPDLMKFKSYQSIQETYYDFANIFSKPINLIDDKADWVQQLYQHQYTGISQISSRLNTFGTAVLSDGVGLGKTRTAAGILMNRLENNKSTKTLLIADKKLHIQWRQEFATVGIYSEHFEAITREKFAELDFDTIKTFAQKFDFVIIDEVHMGFKNRDTKSYQKAKVFKKHGKENLQALLLTATPWNNSRNDVLNIGTMFLNTTNIPNDRLYKQYFIFGNDGKVINQLAQNDKAFNEFWEDIYLQRTRKTIGSEKELFARRQFPTVEIPFEPRKNQLFADNFDRISELEFPYMDPIKYVQGNRYVVGANQLQLMLLKLADSSWIAYYETINKIIENLKEMQNDFQNIGSRSHQRFLQNYLGNKYDLVNYSLKRALNSATAEEQVNVSKFDFEIASEVKKQSYLKRITDLIEGIKPSQAKRIVSTIKSDIVHDLNILETLRSQLHHAYKSRDEKYETVKKVLLEELDQGNKVMVISQFLRTVKYYSDKLAQDPEFEDIQIGVVVGDKNSCHIDNAPYSKEEILTRFSPRAKQKPEFIGSPEEINLIIGTDTISTGQNLQDATVIMNLDLPYNPMQLEQRIGRIDRPRRDQSHVKIHIYTFPIYEAIESELKMTERLGQKMEGVLSDTEFDSVVLPEYASYLRSATQDSSNAVESMLEETVKKSIYEVNSADSHSDQYIKANERMQEFLQNKPSRKNDVVVDNVSFTRGNSNSLAVIRINLNDANGSSLVSENKIIDLYTQRDINISEAEKHLNNSLLYGIDSTKNLPEVNAQELISRINVILESILPIYINQYNQQIENMSFTINKLENKVSKKAAMAIRESTNDKKNITMIRSKLKEANVSAKEVGRIAKSIELVDKEHPLFELVEQIANDITYFWKHFPNFYETFSLYEEDLKMAKEKSQIDVRKANIDKSNYELLSGNISLQYFSRIQTE